MTVSAVRRSPTNRPITARSAGALWGLGMVCLATIGLIACLTRDQDHRNFVILPALTVWLTLGALVATRRPEHRLGPLFVLSCLIALVAMTIAYLTLYIETLWPGHLLAPAWVALAAVGVSDVAIFATLSATFLLFPTGRLLSPRWRFVLWLTVAAYLTKFLGLAQPGPVLAAFPTIPNPLAVANEGPPFGGAAAILGPISALAFLAWPVALITRFRRARGEERMQLKWLSYATVLWVLFLITLALLPPPTPVYQFSAYVIRPLAFAVLPIGMAVAILRYRLYDIDVIINRTLVYSLLTAGVVGLYALLAGTLGALLQARSSFGASLLVAGVVALVFQPLRDRLQQAVNRLMYGERGDPYTVLARFGRQLEGVSELETLLPNIATTIHETLRLPYVAIQLAGEPEPGAAIGVASGAVVPIPLLYAGEQIGEVLVAPRPGEAIPGPVDRHLLEDLARQGSVALHAVRVTADLQRSREQLVTAREEERKRLRRDLHDGLGPALATMTLQADTARGLVRNEPGEAEALLDSLTEQTQSTMQDVRRLIHALRPPVLDDLGLEVALRSLLTPLERSGLTTRFEVPKELPAVSAAVEVALYRIAQEALNNAMKHAHAHSILLRLRVDDPCIVLEVADDGRGITTNRVAGVGLASMRERAEELGGTCFVESKVGGGTRLVARLPVA